jgi:hypothetical protein
MDDDMLRLHYAWSRHPTTTISIDWQGMAIIGTFPNHYESPNFRKNTLS